MNNSEPSPNKPLLIPMSQHAIFSVKGLDAARFLQGQCTCDLNQAEKGKVLLGAHCNPKGRMISSFTLNKIGADEFGLRMRTDIIESSLEAFKKYSVFFKVELSKSELTPIAIINPKKAMPSVAKALPLPFPLEAGNSTGHESTTLSHHNNDFTEIWVLPTQVALTLSPLGAYTTLGKPEDLDHHLIEQGIAEITARTQGEYTPQDLNYQLINGISFKKGCYTGQEIIARMQYRGKLKKHTYCAHIEASTPIQIGASIEDTNSPDKSAGIIVACGPPNAPVTHTTPTSYQVLITTTIDNFAKTDSLIEKYSKGKVSWGSLPYAIP